MVAIGSERKQFGNNQKKLLDNNFGIIQGEDVVDGNFPKQQRDREMQQDIEQEMNEKYWIKTAAKELRKALSRCKDADKIKEHLGENEKDTYLEYVKILLFGHDNQKRREMNMQPIPAEIG